MILLTIGMSLNGHPGKKKVINSTYHISHMKRVVYFSVLISTAILIGYVISEWSPFFGSTINSDVIADVPDEKKLSRRQRNSETSSSIPVNKNPNNDATLKPDDSQFEVPQQLNPGLAKRLIEESFELYPGMVERASYLANIIQALCESGYCEEAWNMIDQHAGMIRSFQITQFFKSSNLDHEVLFAKMRGIPENNSAAINGFFSRFDPDELMNLLKSDLGNNIGRMSSNFNIKSAISSSLMLSLSNTPNSEHHRIIGSIFDFHQQGLIDERDVYLIINRNSIGTPFERWEYLESIHISDQHALDMRKSLIRNMVGLNAVEAMDVLMKSNVIDFKSGVDEWIHNDPTAAASWYERNRNHIEPVYRNAVAESGFDLAISYRDFDVASQWMMQVTDDDLRSKLVEKIQAASIEE